MAQTKVRRKDTSPEAGRFNIEQEKKEALAERIDAAGVKPAPAEKAATVEAGRPVPATITLPMWERIWKVIYPAPWSKYPEKSPFELAEEGKDAFSERMRMRGITKAAQKGQWRKMKALARASLSLDVRKLALCELMLAGRWDEMGPVAHYVAKKETYPLHEKNALELEKAAVELAWLCNKWEAYPLPFLKQDGAKKLQEDCMKSITDYNVFVPDSAAVAARCAYAPASVVSHAIKRATEVRRWDILEKIGDVCESRGEAGLSQAAYGAITANASRNDAHGPRVEYDPSKKKWLFKHEWQHDRLIAMSHWAKEDLKQYASQLLEEEAPQKSS